MGVTFSVESGLNEPWSFISFRQTGDLRYDDLAEYVKVCYLRDFGKLMSVPDEFFIISRTL